MTKNTSEIIKVMVAEDFDLLRDYFCELIQAQNDMEIVGKASSGSEITALAMANDCDIILMDIEMENFNAGIVAAETLRQVKLEQKIIFLTAHETEDMIFTAMGTGAVDYVVKGCSDEEVLSHIRAAYNGKPIMEARIQNKLMREYSRLRRSEYSLLFFIHNISQLTTAERELIRLLLQDKKVKEIAEIRYVEIVTVKTQIKSLLRKFGCSRTKEIIQLIHQLNIEHLF